MQDKDGNMKGQEGGSERPRDARDNSIDTPNEVDPNIDKPPYDGPKGGGGHSDKR